MAEKPDNEKKTAKRISVEQKAALEAAGYKVNKSGTSVQDKDGGTVGGFNENGQISSGSSKVTAILKSSPKPVVAKAPVKVVSTKPQSSAKPQKKPSLSVSTKASANVGNGAKASGKGTIVPKPTSVVGRIGAAIGGWEGRQRKPVSVPESKGTTNPVSKAAGSVGGALGSLAAKLATGRGAAAKAPNRAELFKQTPKATTPKLRPLTAADRDRTASVSAKRLEEMRKRKEKR